MLITEKKLRFVIRKIIVESQLSVPGTPQVKRVGNLPTDMFTQSDIKKMLYNVINSRNLSNFHPKKQKEYAILYFYEEVFKNSVFPIEYIMDKLLYNNDFAYIDSIIMEIMNDNPNKGRHDRDRDLLYGCSKGAREIFPILAGSDIVKADAELKDAKSQIEKAMLEGIHKEEHEKIIKSVNDIVLHAINNYMIKVDPTVPMNNALIDCLDYLKTFHDFSEEVEEDELS